MEVGIETEEYAVSDCVNAKSNVLGDCDGRVSRVGKTIVCEGCYNREEDTRKADQNRKDAVGAKR